jgi:hypothetical protein
MCHTTLALGTFGTPMRVDLPQEVPETLAASVPFPSRLGSPADGAFIDGKRSAKLARPRSKASVASRTTEAGPRTAPCR